MAIKVLVAGAKGRMGSEVVKMVENDSDLKLVAAVHSDNNLEEALVQYLPDVLVDFTTPHIVKENMLTAIHHKVKLVVGTTGLSARDIEELEVMCKQNQVGAIIAPNFAIGAILMMKFAQQAAKYMPEVEIIEMHHDRKLDAPSGTAIKTAEMIAEVRPEHKQGHPEEKEEIDGARGAFYQGFTIHSVRLPGLVAHQQVIFGSIGQTLTIRHDSIDRTSFMPGVNLAIKKVIDLSKLVYGLEKVID